MTCDSSHMQHTRHEREMVKVCQLLLYVQSHCHGMILPNWIRANSHGGYPDCSRLDHATATLCGACIAMTDHDQARIIYNGRDSESRRLADWWEARQAADVARAKLKAKQDRRKQLQISGWNKLTSEEREALRLLNPE